jgi:anthranilate phosphoribosyltransferase
MITLEPETLLRRAVARVTAGDFLEEQTMTDVVNVLMECDLAQEPYQILAGSLLCSLKTRGESIEEIVGAARSLREHQVSVPLDTDGALLDTCGTGGDGAHLINISTITGIVVASLGVKVAKHGNRSVSSACGSADLLEELGYPLCGQSSIVSQCVKETGFGFFFAPHFHPALKNLAGLRRALGVRTLFNMLGPIVNPAMATHQLIGVFAKEIVSPIARAAAKLGLKRCLVVHGEGGLDEISPYGKSWVSLCQDDQLEELEWSPETFAASPVPLRSLAGGNARENARKCLDLFAGNAPEIASAVAMNCAAGLWLVGEVDTLIEGYERAFAAIQSGSVGEYFDSAKRFAVERSTAGQV